MRDSLGCSSPGEAGGRLLTRGRRQVHAENHTLLLKIHDTALVYTRALKEFRAHGGATWRYS